jgi:hypothetical protein
MCCIMRQCFGVGTSYGSWLGLTIPARGGMSQLGDSHRTEGTTEFYHSCLGPGAKRVWWNVFPSSVTVFGCKPARESHQCYSYQRGPLGGGEVAADCHLVSLPQVGAWTRATWVWAQCRADRGSTGCPLGPKMPGLEVTVMVYDNDLE